MIKITNIFIKGVHSFKGIYPLKKGTNYTIFFNGQTDEKIPKLSLWERLRSGKLYKPLVPNPLKAPRFKIHAVKKQKGGHFTVIATIRFSYTDENTRQFELLTNTGNGVQCRALRIRVPPKDAITKYSM